jgi:hypothetical protein
MVRRDHKARPVPRATLALMERPGRRGFKVYRGRLARRALRGRRGQKGPRGRKGQPEQMARE